MFSYFLVFPTLFSRLVEFPLAILPLVDDLIFLNVKNARSAVVSLTNIKSDSKERRDGPPLILHKIPALISLVFRYVLLILIWRIPAPREEAIDIKVLAHHRLVLFT